MFQEPGFANALFHADPVTALRTDLALALRAAAAHGLGEGVCNHFSVALPGDPDHFLLNPRGLMWNEVQADDIVLVDAHGNKLAGRHEVEPTAMFIHAAIHRIAGKACVLHTHMPYATALTLTTDRGLDTTLSQNAMRFHGRLAIDGAYNGPSPFGVINNPNAKSQGGDTQTGYVLALHMNLLPGNLLHSEQFPRDCAEKSSTSQHAPKNTSKERLLRVRP